MESGRIFQWALRPAASSRSRIMGEVEQHLVHHTVGADGVREIGTSFWYRFGLPSTK